MADEQLISYVISMTVANESNACRYKREITGQFLGLSTVLTKSTASPI